MAESYPQEPEEIVDIEGKEKVFYNTVRTIFDIERKINTIIYNIEKE